ncbi:MAG: glycosyltransferase family 4 protein, partial [Phycisphaerae bacterium]|nr:glycosyltransferase family 4 protein [Phycisphaerae bacterium]
AFTTTDKPGPYDNVLYRTVEEFEPWAKYYPHDILIGQRQPNLMSFHSASKLKILWCHDLPHAALKDQFTSCLWSVDKIAVVSEWMRDRYMSVYGIDKEFFHIAENAVDLDLVRSIGEPVQRDPLALLYIARPERGLDRLVKEVFPRLLEKDSRYTLHLAGYDNPVEHLKPFYMELAALCQQFGDRAKSHGHLPKADLYRLMKSCGAYVYPQPSEVMPDFREVSCIAAMEARACGLPFVGMDRGALGETLAGDPGTVLLPEPFDPGEFAD